MKLRIGQAGWTYRCGTHCPLFRKRVRPNDSYILINETSSVMTDKSNWPTYLMAHIRVLLRVHSFYRWNYVCAQFVIARTCKAPSLLSKCFIIKSFIKFIPNKPWTNPQKPYTSTYRYCTQRSPDLINYKFWNWVLSSSKVLRDESKPSYWDWFSPLKIYGLNQ